MTKVKKPISQSRFGKLANRVLTELFDGNRDRMGFACRINPVSVHRWVTDEELSPNNSSLTAFRELLGIPEATLKQYLDGKIELSQLWEQRLKRDYSTVHEVEWLLRWARTLDKRAQLDIGATLVAECAQSLSTTPGLWETGANPAGVKLTPKQCSLLVRLAGSSLTFQHSGMGVVGFLQSAGLSLEQENQILEEQGVSLSRMALNTLGSLLLRPESWANVYMGHSTPQMLGCNPYRSGDELMSDLENWEQASQQTPPVDS